MMKGIYSKLLVHSFITVVYIFDNSRVEVPVTIKNVLLQLLQFLFLSNTNIQITRRMPYFLH